MASRADLTTRVSAVLDSQQRRGRAGTFRVSLACAAAAVLVLAMAPLQVVAAPQAADVRAIPGLKIRANVMLVIETVRDTSGKVVEGLSANDFAVTEDGVAQAISFCEFQKLNPEPQGTPGSISSYYILGYYTTNQKADGTFRRIKVTRRNDTTARLDYRAGHYLTASTAEGSIGNSAVDAGVGRDITGPILLYKIDPEYAEEARKAKYTPESQFSVDVTASGQVTNIKPIRTLGLGLDEKASEAIQQWKFKPGMKDGKPIAVQMQVEVNFRLL